MRDSLPSGLRDVLSGEEIGRLSPADIPALVRQLTEQMRQIERAPLEQEPPTGGGGGRTKIFGFKGDPADPIYNGEMIAVTSSNVHSIGYQINKQSPNSGSLLVRYLQKQGTSSVAGDMYEYPRVHPAVFDSMRAAASKGKFVWDRLRVRGSVSGHRYHYRLKEIRGGKVPRQAVRYGNNEYFIGRQFHAANVKTGEKRTFNSSLPDRKVRQIKSLQLLPGGRRVPLVQR